MMLCLGYNYGVLQKCAFLGCFEGYKMRGHDFVATMRSLQETSAALKGIILT